jgi:ATP phosphoribosyltransferase
VNAASPSLRLALPSKGRPYEETLAFMADCGLAVARPNPRQYVARIPSVPNVTVVFDHSSEIPTKLRNGSADCGITGIDSLLESGESDDDRSAIIVPDLGFLHAVLAVAVPDAWVDVWSVNDLADLSVRFRERNRTLRVASDWPNLTRSYLHRSGIYYVDVIEQPGAVESAPMMGYADAISTLTSTGTSLRENRLKLLEGGDVLHVQQCFVANLITLRQHPEKLVALKTVLEYIDGRAQARDFVTVVANVCATSAAEVSAHIWQHPDLAGLQGPTIAPVFSRDPDDVSWFAVTLVAPRSRLLDTVRHLRASGGSGITVYPATYVFDQSSKSFAALQERLATHPTS